MLKKIRIFASLVFLSFAVMAESSQPSQRPQPSSISETDLSDVVQSVKFTGQLGFIAEARIVRKTDSDPSLMIFHKKIKTNEGPHVVIDNSMLSLTVDGMDGTESSLSVTSKGALQVHQKNISIGRHRWTRILTISFRGGEYVVSGFTLNSYDTLVENSDQSCDYNLLTQKGQRNGKSIRIHTRPFP